MKFPKPAVQLAGYSVLPLVRKSEAKDDESKRLNGLVYALKDGRSLDVTREGVKETKPAAVVFAGMLELAAAPWLRNAVLIPLPGSQVSPKDRSTEKTVLFAQAIRSRFGGQVFLGLVRRIAVVSAHRVQSDQRPKVEDHFTSMALVGELPQGDSLVLVDDVLTRGSTAVGAARVLQGADNSRSICVVAGAHTRFPTDPTEAHVEWEISWFEGAEHPHKHSTRVHMPLRGQT